MGKLVEQLGGFFCMALALGLSLPLSGCQDNTEQVSTTEDVEPPTLPDLQLPDKSVDSTAPGSEPREPGDGGVQRRGSERLPESEAVVEESEAELPPLSDLELEVPSSLGPGFVDISGEILSGNLLVFDPWDGSLTDEAELTSGIFMDVDGDGTLEVVCGAERGCQSGSCPVVYAVSDDGTLVHDPELQEYIPALKKGTIIGYFDVDGNGQEDILLGYAEGRIMLRGDDGEWVDAEKFPPPSGYPYSFLRDKAAMAVVDLDEDGLLDVLVGDSTCEEGSTTLRVFLQRTPGKFSPRDDVFGADFPGSPDALLATPLGPDDGFVVQMLGRSCSAVEPHSGFYRRVGWSEFGYPEFESFDPFNEYAHFKDMMSVSYGPYTLIHPMAATVGDLDLDGHWDTVSTYSTPDVGFDYSMPLFGVFRGVDAWPFEDRSVFSNAGPPAGVDGLSNQIPWGNALLDINGDGLADLLTANGPDWEGLHQESRWAGLQDLTLHMAVGYFKFEEATSLLGFEQPGNWRSLTVGDLERDGDPDLIVGGYGEKPRVYRNDVETENRMISIRLKGHTSNSLGVGAVVKVLAEQAVKEQPQLMGHIGSPMAISEPLVFAGLGPADKAEKVTVQWPSGYVQEVYGLEAGMQHTIEEPPLIEIEPGTRRLTLGQEATLLVTPRNPDGTYDPDAEVSASAFAGKGTVGTPVNQAEGWIVTVTSPDEPGSTVVEISIDGAPMGVRPRLVWSP